MTAWRPAGRRLQERQLHNRQRSTVNGPRSTVHRQSVVGRDLDGCFQGPVNRAIPGVHGVHPLDGLLLAWIRLNPVADVDPPDNEHSVFGLNFTSDFSCELTVAGVNLTRFQRASQCTGESTTRGRNHIIQGGRPWVEVIRSQAVVPGHVAVHPESDGLVFRGQIGTIFFHLRDAL